LEHRIEHEEAVRSQAAEHYVAHELSPAEQEAFEAHFFDCRACADEVRFELTFAANVRAVCRETAQQPLQPAWPKAARWKNWEWLRLHPVTVFSFTANIALVAGLGYILTTGTPSARVPRFTQPVFAPAPTHGAGDVHAVPRGETWYAVRFPSPGPGSQPYSYEILDTAGRRESSGSLPAPAGDEDFHYLEVPLGRLPAGVHTLLVRGGPGSAIVSWSRFRTSR